MKHMSNLTKDKINASGLTLVELMFAIVLVGAATLSLVRLQSILFRNVFAAHALEERLHILQNTLVQADREDWSSKVQTKQADSADPETKITYKLEKMDEGSALGKIPYLFKERVDGFWDDIIGARDESFISFKFNPKEPKA
jgi:Tfp pilus assembly protein PilV